MRSIWEDGGSTLLGGKERLHFDLGKGGFEWRRRVEKEMHKLVHEYHSGFRRGGVLGVPNRSG